MWEAGKVQKRLGRMVYIVEGPRGTYKKHINQMRRRTTEDPEGNPSDQSEIMKNLYDAFELVTPKTPPEARRSQRKRKLTGNFEVDPAKKIYIEIPGE